MLRARFRFSAWAAVALVIGLWALPGAAPAQVTVIGAVTPAVPMPGDIVIVGDEEAPGVDILGRLTIAGGAAVDWDQLIVGQEDIMIGEVTVTGPGTYVELDEVGSVNPALLVGDEGTGRLTISDGAQVDVANTVAGTMLVGDAATGLGFVTVEGVASNGTPTRLTVAEDLIVGDAGYGELVIRGGALVNQPDTGESTLTVGASTGGEGLVVIEGQGTFYQAPENLAIGVTGLGTLRLGDGAILDADNNFRGTTVIGPNGFFDMQGGRFFTEAATVNGRLGGRGLVAGPVTVSATGEVSSGPGEKLRFTGAVANSGLVNISGTENAPSEIEFAGALTNADPGPPDLPGRIAVNNGVVRFSQTLTNDGVLASTGGATDFHGDITNGAAGLIAIGGESNATFFDTVNVTAGTLNIAAGSTAFFLGDISISAGVNLVIGVDASALETGFDTPLQALGTTTLDAPITLSLQSGFVPSEGDTIPLIEAAGGLSVGVVDPSNFDPLPAGLAWDLILTGDSVAAVVIPEGIDPGAGPLDGDFNGDNMVGAADYAVWRDTLGANGSQPADADGSGAVGPEDFGIWSGQFGAFSPPPLVEGPPVPEPAGACLLLACAGLLAAPRRRHG